MNNEKEENKKAWETPEIIDLDVNIYTKMVQRVVPMAL